VSAGIRRGAAEIETLLGGRVSGWMAEPEREAPLPGVVLVHDSRGLDDPTRAACERVAALGCSVLAPDLLAGRDADAIGDPEGVLDLDACVSALRAHERAAGGVGVVGFGWGGRLALVLATGPAAPDRAVVCDAPGVTRRTAVVDASRPQVPLDRLPHLGCPLLWLSGAAAANPSAEDVDEVRGALAGGGLEHRVVVLPGESSGLPAAGASEAWDVVADWLAALRRR
jgi:carboxymethylenebutenolidase